MRPTSLHRSSPSKFARNMRFGMRSILYHILNNHIISLTRTSIIPSVLARPFSCKWKHECIRKETAEERAEFGNVWLMNGTWENPSFGSYSIFFFHAMPTRPTLYIVCVCVRIHVSVCKYASIFHLNLHNCIWWLAKEKSPVQKYKQHLLSKEIIR